MAATKKDSGKVNIHGKEYETVASRVQRFREEHNDEYAIVTEIVERTEQFVVMKASILCGDERSTVVATGFAEESRTSSSINRTSALENCETSAIGRALANFGLAGTEYASADEVANAVGQRATSQSATSAAPAKRPGGLITYKQLSFMASNFNELGLEEREERLDYVNKVIGRQVDSAKDLTLSEAKKVIDMQLADKGVSDEPEV